MKNLFNTKTKFIVYLVLLAGILSGCSKLNKVKELTEKISNEDKLYFCERYVTSEVGESEKFKAGKVTRSISALHPPSQCQTLSSYHKPFGQWLTFSTNRPPSQNSEVCLPVYLYTCLPTLHTHPKTHSILFARQNQAHGNRCNLNLFLRQKICNRS